MSATAPSWVTKENENGSMNTIVPNNATTSQQQQQQHPSWLSDDLNTSNNPTGGSSGYTAGVMEIDDKAEKNGNESGLRLARTWKGKGNIATGDNDNDNDNSLSHAQRAREKTWGDFWSSSFSRDGRTLLITLAVIIMMNIRYVKWALYPFSIFSTWIHEVCHGMAAVMAGGSISKLELYPDTSGLAFTSTPNGQNRPFIISAGYQGTAVVGMLLLMIRRTKRGPRAGTMIIAFFMALSVALWIRNVFGILFILAMAIVLAIAAWFLSSFWIRNLYVLLSVTCTLNAITSVRVLFGSTGEVNGQDVTSDAEAMAEAATGTRMMWALIWLFLALGLALFGFMFAIPAPDQSADFTLCGMCQDCGCFYICNANGRRLWSTLFGKKEKEDESGDENGNGSNVV